MSRITNHHALSQELYLAYDKAIQRFPDKADEIDDVFEKAKEVHRSIRVIDQCIDTMDLKWVEDTSLKFMDLAHRLFNVSNDHKDMFTWRDTLVSWRGSPVKNIVYAIEIEADWYMFYFDSFHPGSTDVEKFLLSLRSEIRQRAAKGDDAVNAGSSSTWTPDAEEEARGLIQDGTLITADAENRSTWTPDAEKVARRLIQEGTVTTAQALQERLSMNRQVVQDLYRHITGKKKKRYQVD